MAHAPILQQDKIARRTVKAQNIIAAQECIPVDDMPGWFQCRDTMTGSGSWHLATVNRCDCRDALKNVCKHQLAVRAEERSLAQYCADWNTRSEQARAAAVDLDLPGNFLDTALNFDDVSLTAEDLDWLTDDVNRDVPSNGYGADGWPEQRCPDCNAPLQSRSYHVGGKGLTCFLVCTKDIEHQAVLA